MVLTRHNSFFFLRRPVYSNKIAKFEVMRIMVGLLLFSCFHLIFIRKLLEDVYPISELTQELSRPFLSDVGFSDKLSIGESRRYASKDEFVRAVLRDRTDSGIESILHFSDVVGLYITYTFAHNRCYLEDCSVNSFHHAVGPRLTNSHGLVYDAKVPACDQERTTDKGTASICCDLLWPAEPCSDINSEFISRFRTFSLWWSEHDVPGLSIFSYHQMVVPSGLWELNSINVPHSSKHDWSTIGCKYFFCEAPSFSCCTIWAMLYNILGDGFHSSESVILSSNSTCSSDTWMAKSVSFFHDLPLHA